MSEIPASAAGLYRDSRNTAPPTRARFEFQDACVALRCIHNLLPSSPVVGVALEWSTDYVLLTGDGHWELVSVKHRDPGQNDWSYAELKKENVLRDLHAVWKQMSEAGEYVFESNRGFSHTAKPYVIDATHPRADQQDVETLARDLGIDVDEADRFLDHLRLRRHPLPDRSSIDSVAIIDLQSVMTELSLDPMRAADAYQAIAARIATASTQRPLSPTARVDRMAGLMRDVAARTGPSLAEHYLSIDDLRRLVQEIGGITPRAALAVDPLFVGRTSLMGLLDSHLNLGDDQQVAPVVLSGIPGIGKSALVRQYAATRSAKVVAWVVPADSRAALAQGLYALAGGTARPLGRDAGLRASTITGQTPSLPEDPHLLLIIDGVTDPATTAGLIPRRSLTRFVVTSTATHLDDAFVHLQVDPLDQADSVEYLHSVLSDESPEALARVAHVFAGHPLGLVQAASYCRSQRISASGYLQRVVTAPVPLLDLGRAADHPTPTATAIRELFRVTVESEPAVIPLAVAMACAAPEPLPERVFERQILVRSEDGEPSPVEIQLVSLTDVLVRDRAVAALHQSSLVVREGDELHIHPLVQTVVKDTMPADDRAAWARACLVLLLHAANTDQDEYFTASSAAIFGAHIAACVEYAIAEDSDPYMIFAALGWLGMWQLRSGDLHIAVSYLTRCVQVGRRVTLDEGITEVLAHLATAQRMAGMVDQSLATIDEWVGLSRIDDDAAGSQKALLARAQTYAYAARYPEARDAFYALTPPGTNEKLGVRDRIFRLSLLADIQQGLGQHDQALASITEALALVPDVSHEGQRIDHLAALHKQAGVVLRDAGRPQEALPHLRDAYDVAANLPAAYTAETILVLVNTLLDLGLQDEARSLIDEGMALALPRGHTSPTRGSFLQARGRLALEAENFTAAAADLEAAITMLRTGGDPYRTNLASGYYNLGLVHLAQHRYSASVDCLRRARELEATVYGADGGDALLIDAELAQAYFAAGDQEAASETIIRCLGLIRSGHPQARRRRNRVLGIAISIDLAHRWPEIYGTTDS